MKRLLLPVIIALGLVTVALAQSLTGVSAFTAFLNVANVFTQNQTINGGASNGTTTPDKLTFGANYSSVPGFYPKIDMYGGAYGFGLSAGQTEIFGPRAAFFYSGALYASVSSSGLRHIPATLATVGACSGNEGSLATITDSTVATPGSTIAGGGANHVLGYCNGTNWIVK